MEILEAELLQRIHNTKSKRSEALSKLMIAFSGNAKQKKNIDAIKSQESTVNLKFEKETEKEEDVLSNFNII